jgi:hypothetical protein
MYDMPVIPKKRTEEHKNSTALVHGYNITQTLFWAEEHSK